MSPKRSAPRAGFTVTGMLVLLGVAVDVQAASPWTVYQTVFGPPGVSHLEGAPRNVTDGDFATAYAVVQDANATPPAGPSITVRLRPLGGAGTLKQVGEIRVTVRVGTPLQIGLFSDEAYVGIGGGPQPARLLKQWIMNAATCNGCRVDDGQVFSWTAEEPIAMDDAFVQFSARRALSGDLLNNPIGFLEVELIEAEAPPVEVRLSTTAMTLNEEGWYRENPLDVTVALHCPPAGPPCVAPLNLSLEPAPASAKKPRLWALEWQHYPQMSLCSTQRGDPAGTYSFQRYEAACLSAAVPPGETRETRIRVWVQPSPESVLRASASWGSATGEKALALPKASIRPLLFLPGILGTMPPSDAETAWMDPVLDTYSPLLINLEKMGHLRFDPYQPEKPSTLFPVPYDWRESNDRSADRLADRIPQALDLARQLDYVGEPEGGPAAKVDLVVHSMGGLVTRAYAQRDRGPGPGQYHGDIRRAVFIATPHRGMPATYRTWEGFTWDNYLPTLQHLHLRALIDGVIWPKYVFKKFAPTRLEMDGERCGLDPLLPPQIDCPFQAFVVWSHGGRNDEPERGIESLPQMLPDDAWPDYLFCAAEAGQTCADGEVNPYGRPGNPWLTSLNADVDRLAANLGPANIAVVYGTGTATDLTYRVAVPASPFWRNGRVVSGALDPGNPPVGDDLIPADSMNLSLLLPGIPAGNVFERTGPTARHKEIVFHADVQTSIVPGFLTGQTLLFSEPYVIDLPTQGVPLVFDVDCPVNLTVTDPQNHRAGFDPATGGFVNEIPGAIYAAPGTRGQFVLVRGAPGGKWQMRLEAFEDGDYGATVWRLDSDRPRALARFTGSLAAGAVARHDVRIEDTIFADAFDRPNSTDLGPAWEERTGNWRIRSGALHVGGAASRHKEALTTASLVGASFTLETRLRLAGSQCGDDRDGDRDREGDEDEQGTSRAEVSFGRASDGTGGYGVVINPRRRLLLVRADGSILGRARISAGECNVWRRIKVVRGGDGSIAVYLDEGGGYPADPQIRAHDRSHLDVGRLGFGLRGEGSGLDVDWITLSGG